jgi:hypothetical protein
VVKPNSRRRTNTTSFSLRQSWGWEVTPTILRYMLTLATEFMPALAASRIISASEARGVGAGAPVSARLNVAGTGADDKLDKLSTGVPPPAPPAGEAVEAPAGARGQGPSARRTVEMAGAARDEERTGSEAHGDGLTQRRHRPWRTWRRGPLKKCIVAAPIFVHNHVGRTTRAPDVIVNGIRRD